jgi:hypothetical protein
LARSLTEVRDPSIAWDTSLPHACAASYLFANSK